MSQKGTISEQQSVGSSCCSIADGACGRFQVESVISVDERGQMVLPKELREKARIRPGDKLALVSWEKDGEVCCISMVKADQLLGMVKSLLEPMLTELSES